MPSNAANGPQGWGSIQLWIIGVGSGAGEVRVKVRRLGVSNAVAGRQVDVVGRYLIGAVILDTASSPRASGQRNSEDGIFRVGLEAVLDGLAAGGSDGL